MKLLIKILFFLFAIFQTNISEAKIVVVDIVFSEIKLTAFNVESKNESVAIIENDFDITCKSESDLLDYSILAKFCEATAAKGGAGVYDLGTTLGKYVGQSKDIMGRVTSHFAKGGKLSAGELNNAVFHSMPGSTKLQREVYEQFLINKYGINNLLNVRNPMGGRMNLYNSMVDDVIRQFGLPR